METNESPKGNGKQKGEKSEKSEKTAAAETASALRVKERQTKDYQKIQEKIATAKAQVAAAGASRSSAVDDDEPHVQCVWFCGKRRV